MIERLARLGYTSIGVVYMIVGGLAVAAGLDQRRHTGGHADALQLIRDRPFGNAVLAIIAAGLIGYALWRFVSAATDNEHRGDDAKGLAIRLGSAFRGLVYGAMTVEVLRMLGGKSAGSGEDVEARHWARRLMDAPFGRWLAAAIGIGIVVYGVYQLYAAWDAKLSKRIRLGAMDDRVRRKVVAISRCGIAARGIVFFVVGGSLFLAALRHNPNAAHGTTGALAQLPVPLLIAVGFGLAAYGVYALVNARYRRITA